MPFQYCCPQGHVLQGDESQMGQPCQCPYCGMSFLVPQSMPAMPGGFPPGPLGWPPGNLPQPAMPPSLPPGTMGPGPMFEMPSPFGMPMPAFGMPSPAMSPPSQLPPGMTPFGMPPAAASPQAATPAAETAAEEGKGFVLPFDPKEKAPLPFDIPGSERAESAAAAPSLGPASQPQGVRHIEGQNPVVNPVLEMFPKMPEMPAMPAPAFPPAGVKVAMADLTEDPAKRIHIPCPAGHPVEVDSDQLGRTVRCPLCNRAFPLRYENSLEFGQRRAKILQKRDEKEGQVWLAWAVLAAVAVIGGLVVLAFLSGS